jgi:hypothetical protein
VVSKIKIEESPHRIINLDRNKNLKPEKYYCNTREMRQIFDLDSKSVGEMESHPTSHGNWINHKSLFFKLNHVTIYTTSLLTGELNSQKKNY